MWLPPLNIHTYSNAIISQKIKLELLFGEEPSSSSSLLSVEHEDLTNPSWAIIINVRVNFCAETDKLPIIKGLKYLSKPIIISFHELNSCSTEEAKEILFAKISEQLRFHSRLCSILCHRRFVNSSNKFYSSPPEIEFSKCVMEFLLRIGSDGQQVTLPVMIKIHETVHIKNEIYKGWFCWYKNSKRLNPEFKEKYKAAISRARTDEEISQERLFINKEQALTSILKDIKISCFNDTCSICLEELSEENRGGIKSLRCAHIFHGDCIKKWLLVNLSFRDRMNLKDRRACPLCRGRLHSECIVVLCPLVNFW